MRPEIPTVQQAYSLFLKAEKELKEHPDNSEKCDCFGHAKQLLYLAIKNNTEVLRYYAQGNNDGGKTAKEALGK